MKTEDIDKRIGMPDVDAEWAKFEQEVISKDTASHRSIVYWGLSLAASVAIVAGIFLFWNDDKELTEATVAMAEQPDAPATQEGVETPTETEPAPVAEPRPKTDLIAMATPSKPKSSRTVEETVKEEKVYDCGEVMPQFPGGDRALMEFIKQRLEYPDLAMEYGARGRVIMTCIIDSLGYVSRFKPVAFRLNYDTLRMNREPEEIQVVLKEQIQSLMEEECTRILCMMPRWAPGNQFGRFVSVRYTVPFVFQFNEAEREAYLAQKQESETEMALQGRIAGLDIVPTSADLGPGYAMRLRGLRNRNGNDSVLIVVNGTPLPDSLCHTSYAWTKLIADLYRQGQFIDSIKVYKDENSKKQYGERAKYGVIALTTTPDTLCDAYVRQHQELKQTRRYVEGCVLDENDQPLADAWVGITETAGAATDAKGHFALWLPLTQKDLLATCTGYKSSRMEVQSDSALTFRLTKLLILKDIKIKRDKKKLAIPAKEISKKESSAVLDSLQIMM